MPQQGEHTDVVPGAAEPEGGPGEVHGVFVVAAERPVIPAGVLTLPPQPVVLAVPRGVQGAPQPGPVSPGAAQVCLALQRHVLYCTSLYCTVLYCTVLYWVSSMSMPHLVGEGKLTGLAIISRAPAGTGHSSGWRRRR